MPSDFFWNEVWKGVNEPPVEPFHLEDGPVLSTVPAMYGCLPFKVESSKYPPVPAVATGVDDARQIPVAYVSGPYRDPKGTWWVERNIRQAEEVAVRLWGMGYAVICPHTNTKHMDGAFPSSDEVFITGDLEIVRRCDVCVMMPNWFRSIGARNEYVAAAQAGVLILVWGSIPHEDLIREIGRRGRSAIPAIKAALTREN